MLYKIHLEAEMIVGLDAHIGRRGQVTKGPSDQVKPGLTFGNWSDGLIGLI